MRLLGRRLPDVLIGLLIVVLALGLGSLLLTQRNRAAVTPAPEPGQSAITQPESTPAPPADIPSAPGSDTRSGPDTTAAPETPAPEPAAPDNTAATNSGSALPSDTLNAPTDNATPTGSLDAAPTETAPPETSTDLPPNPEAAPSVPAVPRSGGAVATSQTRTPLRSDYRISLGTFGSVTEAQNATAAVSALGYTVYPIDLGSQVVAQVGPFANAATATAARDDIARVYGGAAVYAPRNTSGSSSNSPSGNSSGVSSSSIPATPLSAPASSASTPASGPLYLQVGAFDRQASAQKLVGQLSELGFAPSVQAPDGKKVTVLIGPFSGDAVARAESKLNDNGLDHFRVR
ncbi:SPOR domain-containing protein [Deinococcus sp.]|uniref:SPOR domain-containing protein n=1 Tax=Deinococcus sp. TaxID=47478 RepID=UPI003B5BCC1C